MATYHGSCQCGAVRLSAELDLDGAVTCNCSRCRRLGSVLTFAPADKFHLEAGEGATTEYLFNRHAISHRFCAASDSPRRARYARAASAAFVPSCIR